MKSWSSFQSTETENLAVRCLTCSGKLLVLHCKTVLLNMVKNTFLTLNGFARKQAEFLNLTTFHRRWQDNSSVKSHTPNCENFNFPRSVALEVTSIPSHTSFAQARNRSDVCPTRSAAHLIPKELMPWIRSLVSVFLTCLLSTSDWRWKCH